MSGIPEGVLAHDYIPPELIPDKIKINKKLNFQYDVMGAMGYPVDVSSPDSTQNATSLDKWGKAGGSAKFDAVYSSDPNFLELYSSDRQEAMVYIVSQLVAQGVKMEKE